MNKKINAVLIGLFFALAIQSHGQSVETNLYPFNYVYINPAISSEEDLLSTGARFENKGKNYGLISYEGWIKKINSGVGFIGYAGKGYGPVARNSFGLFFNHKIRFSEDWSLRLATKIYRQQEMIDFSMYRSTDPNDPLLRSYDGEAKSRVLDDIALVVQYKKIYAGLTTINLLNTHFPSVGISEPSKIKRTYNILIGGQADLTNWLNLNGSLFIPDVNDYSIFDLNAIFTIKKKVMAGATFRSGDNVIRINAGLNIKEHVKVILVLYESDKTTSGLRLETLVAVKI